MLVVLATYEPIKKVQLIKNWRELENLKPVFGEITQDGRGGGKCDHIYDLIGSE